MEKLDGCEQPLNQLPRSSDADIDYSFGQRIRAFQQRIPGHALLLVLLLLFRRLRAALLRLRLCLLQARPTLGRTCRGSGLGSTAVLDSFDSGKIPPSSGTPIRQLKNYCGPSEKPVHLK